MDKQLQWKTPIVAFVFLVVITNGNRTEASDEIFQGPIPAIMEKSEATTLIGRLARFLLPAVNSPMAGVNPTPDDVRGYRLRATEILNTLDTFIPESYGVEDDISKSIHSNAAHLRVICRKVIDMANAFAKDSTKLNWADAFKSDVPYLKSLANQAEPATGPTSKGN